LRIEAIHSQQGILNRRVIPGGGESFSKRRTLDRARTMFALSIPVARVRSGVVRQKWRCEKIAAELENLLERVIALSIGCNRAVGEQLRLIDIHLRTENRILGPGCYGEAQKKKRNNATCRHPSESQRAGEKPRGSLASIAGYLEHVSCTHVLITIHELLGSEQQLLTSGKPAGCEHAGQEIYLREREGGGH
jgi:hypothetical protein